MWRNQALDEDIAVVGKRLAVGIWVGWYSTICQTVVSVGLVRKTRVEGWFFCGKQLESQATCCVFFDSRFKKKIMRRVAGS